MAKRTNFKTMDQGAFIKYLNDRSIAYDKLTTTTVLGLSVFKVIPENSRINFRVFDRETGNQLDQDVELTGIDLAQRAISKKQLIKLIDERIQNMSTKGVYHPKRLKPKWNSLTNDDEKLALFGKYVLNREVSIGLRKLVKVNLCEKTLEAIVIDHPNAMHHVTSENVTGICIEKLLKYKNGRDYLKSKGIEIDDGKKA